ncbi:MAG: PAS domain S-box protein [Pseudorhodobacter sp.]|nr:PAS domain S-box protein [Pseudorhodobacter sp.]
MNDLMRATAGKVDAAIGASLGQLCDIARIERAIVYRRPARDGFEQYCQASATGFEPAGTSGEPLPAGLVSSWLANPGDLRPIRIPDADNLAENAAASAFLGAQRMGSSVLVPMREAGQLTGVICFSVSDKAHSFGEDQLDLLQAVTDLIEALLTRCASEVHMLETAHRLEATLAALPDLLFEIDADGRYTGFLAGPASLMVALPTTLAGRTLTQQLPKDVAEITKRAFREVLAKGSVRGVCYQLDVPAGKRWFELAGGLKPASSPNGRPSVVFLVRDVTEDARMRNDLLRLGKIVEAMDNLVVIMDVELRVDWVNQAFEDQTGWRLAEIRGKDLASLLRCPQSDPATIARLNDAIARKVAFKGETINRDRHGKCYWIDFNVLPLFGPDGQLQGYVSIETVVTKLKEQDVAIRQLAQTAEAAHARLENAIKALPDGIVIFDAEDRLIASNDAYLEAMPKLAAHVKKGITLTELLRIGLDKGVFLAGATAKAKEKWLANRLAEYRKPQHIDDVRLADGRWLHRINSRTSDGGCIAIGIDITNQHKQIAAIDAVNKDLMQALEERNKAKRRLGGIVEAAEIGTWEWDAAADTLDVGGRWGEIIGRDTSTLTSLKNADFRELVHPDDMLILDQTRDGDLAQPEATIEREFRMRHRDGHWVWILSRSQVTQRAPDGTALRLAGVHLDISARKQLEHDMAASRAYIAQVMDTNASAVIVLNGEGGMTFANSEAERVLGLRRTDILGRAHNDPGWALERVEGGPLPEDELPLSRALRARKPVRDIRFALHRPDGERRILSCNAAPLNIDGDHPEVVVSFTDITDSLAATARLQAALSQAEDMSRAKSVFLANMSHEIRTPLNGVLGMAEVLADSVTEPNQKRMISTIRKSGETLLTVLNGILDMSKIEAGKMVLETVPFSPLELVRQVEAIYKIQAEGKGLEFEVFSSAGCDKPRLGDPHRIQQILNNLLNNAIKFTEAGSVTLKLSCRTGKPVTIEVSDTGLGMDPAQLARVFESFEQADGSTTRRFGGTGLGLAIVKQLVALMGGEITPQSTPGLGTSFSITLPLPESTSVLPGEAEAAQDTQCVDVFRGVRILSADDNATNQMVLAAMLAKSGAILTQVEDGQKAVDAWAEAQASGSPFSLLLLDITMPVRDGLSALAEIRATEAAHGLTSTPAIAVTANAMPHQVADYVIGGFDTHLAKPFRQRDLLHTLETLMRV